VGVPATGQVNLAADGGHLRGRGARAFGVFTKMCFRVDTA
jgi:hypothetical protein